MTLVWPAFTILVYFCSKWLYARTRKLYLTPLVVTPAVVIGALLLSGSSYDTFDRGGHWIGEMIGPATISLAVTLHKQIHVLKKHARAIVAGVTAGGLAAVAVSAGLARLFGLAAPIVDSLAPKSATTPVAVSVSGALGGLSTITAVATLATGLTGMLVGPLLVRWMRIRSSVGRGILLGTAAHSAGIAKALEYDADAGACAGIAMVCTAFVTLCAAGPIVALFR
ncbi:LrgB family protein [Cohnella sp. GbtcB17]|uniref:LrgB family protein n=1 Tax=Cohnella sp. GbtcB17 TaxID=2824762 RepID=UPI001C301387|nr:LrgB family protein [Cohnella sp. GbtcB17]